MAKRYGSTVFDDEEVKTTSTNYRRVMSASTLTGDNVVNAAGEDLGKIHDIMFVPLGSGPKEPGSRGASVPVPHHTKVARRGR